METVRNKKFKNVALEVDDHGFVDCEFVNCDFVYSGGEFQFTNSPLTGRFGLQLKGAASRTVDFLKLFRLLPGGTPIPKSIN